MVGHLRRRAHRGPTLIDPALRSDGDGDAQPGHAVDRGFGALAGALAFVERERLQIATSGFGFEHVVDQARLAGSGETGDDGQLALGEIGVDVLQIVGTRAANGDVLGANAWPALRLSAGMDTGFLTQRRCRQ